jgi:prophage regulatory protein
MSLKRKELLLAETAVARRFIRLPAVMDITSLSTSTIYDAMKAGTFPKPVKLFSGPHGKKSAVAWIQDEILQWMADRMADRDEGHAPGKASEPVTEAEEPEAPEDEAELSHKEQVLRELKQRAAAKRKTRGKLRKPEAASAA